MTPARAPGADTGQVTKPAGTLEHLLTTSSLSIRTVQCHVRQRMCVGVGGGGHATVPGLWAAAPRARASFREPP